ncbi:unnamed protein product, partial [Porites lobata]
MEQNCRKLNCKVTPVGENLESEFRLKASEKGVRIVYLNLKIGNNSYNPLDLPDEFLPDRWVWARSNNEPMLSLPFNFDILSLGLLNYQVGSMTVPLRDEPNGCLAGLNSTCQNLAVGRGLLDNVTLSESGNTGVVCVGMILMKLSPSINYHCCSSNVSSIHCDLSVVGSKWLQAIKAVLYCLSAVVVLYCPAFLLLLPDCIFNLQNECNQEEMTENQLPLGVRNEYQRIQSEEENRLSRNTDEIPVDDASPVTCSTFLLGSLLYLHNRSLRKVVGLSTCYLMMNYRGSRVRRALFSLWLSFSCLFTLFLGLVLAAICLFLLLVSGVFLFICFMGFFYLFTLYLLIILFILFAGVYILCTFFVGILGFTTMGLVLNVEIVTPYVSFLVVATTNVYFCYAKLQRNYTEVKEFILKYRQQELDSISGTDQSTIPTNLFWFVSDEVLPVTTEICLMLRNMAVIVIFLFLTISSIIFFRNEYEISTPVSTIAVFISGAIPSLFFKGLTGGKNFSGWRKIQLERKIKVAVREY